MEIIYTDKDGTTVKFTTVVGNHNNILSTKICCKVHSRGYTWPGKNSGCCPVKNRLCALCKPWVRYGSNAGSIDDVLVVVAIVLSYQNISISLVCCWICVVWNYSTSACLRTNIDVWVRLWRNMIHSNNNRSGCWGRCYWLITIYGKFLVGRRPPKLNIVISH